MINVYCPLKTCQAKNDPDACKCWNCGGPMPENAFNSAAAKAIMAKAEPWRENPAPPVIKKAKVYSAKDVTIVMKGAGPNGEDLAFRENEEGHWVADARFQPSSVGPDLDKLGELVGVYRKT